MKIQVLLLAGCIAITTAARGQTDPAPAAPTTPAAPADAAPAAPTNAPAAAPAPAAPDAPNAAAQPAATIATNQPPLEASRTNAAAEIVPLIVIDDVPLIDAVKNLARQAGLNYLPDPKLATITTCRM